MMKKIDFFAATELLIKYVCLQAYNGGGGGYQRTFFTKLS